MLRSKKKRMVIIGNSATGLSALEAFRKRDKESEVLMIDKEPYLAYSRVITPYFIMGCFQKEEGLFLRTEDFYKELNVKALFGREVLSIDICKRQVVLDKGGKEPFDSLLIATGGSPLRPKIEGAEPEDVFVLRNLSDARQLKERKENIQSILFMGAGLVSLQTLQAMFKTGGRYTLVVKSDQIMSQTIDREGSEIVEKQLEKMGIRIMKGRDVIQLKEVNGSKVAILDNGEEIKADILFAGKGVRPNISVLNGSGIKTQTGILVNEYVETEVEGVYAGGDVAQAPDFYSCEKVNYGLWPSAVEQGEIAGKNMAGEKEVYAGNLRMNVTRIFGIPIASIGDFRSKRVTQSLVKRDEKRNVYRRICLDERGIIIGAILINEVSDLGVIQGLVRKRKSAAILKSNSIWKSPINYGVVYKNIQQRRL
jgi:nitrite reductase (NADH) large subunit